MKLIKRLILLPLLVVMIALFLTLFGVITNNFVIASIHLINGICLILILIINNKEKKFLQK